uniref:Fibrinogen C-terminal domain-containing protein n=1 Tax=Angiostrongylus cantonensis TaxID=6313 RepID=A0A0K0DMV2_ANGCA
MWWYKQITFAIQRTGRWKRGLLTPLFITLKKKCAKNFGTSTAPTTVKATRLLAGGSSSKPIQAERAQGDDLSHGSLTCLQPILAFRIVTCSTEVPPNADLEKEGLDVKLPRGWYRIGVQTIRNDHSWFNLYRRKATGNGYWDFYTNIPERNCIGFGPF